MKILISLCSTSATPQLLLLSIAHSIITSHPIWGWVLIKAKRREGRRAGKWEGCRFSGGTLPQWGSAGTKAEKATCQQRVFSLKDDRKRFDVDSPDLNEKVGVSGKASVWLSSDGEWGQPPWAALHSWLCGCSSAAASLSSISATSVSSTWDGCSCKVNTNKYEAKVIHEAQVPVLWIKKNLKISAENLVSIWYDRSQEVNATMTGSSGQDRLWAASWPRSSSLTSSWGLLASCEICNVTMKLYSFLWWLVYLFKKNKTIWDPNLWLMRKRDISWRIKMFFSKSWAFY